MLTARRRSLRLLAHHVGANADDIAAEWASVSACGDQILHAYADSGAAGTAPAWILREGSLREALDAVNARYEAALQMHAGQFDERMLADAAVRRPPQSLDCGRSVRRATAYSPCLRRERVPEADSRREAVGEACHASCAPNSALSPLRSPAMRPSGLLAASSDVEEERGDGGGDGGHPGLFLIPDGSRTPLTARTGDGVRPATAAASVHDTDATGPARVHPSLMSPVSQAMSASAQLRLLASTTTHAVVNEAVRPVFEAILTSAQAAMQSELRDMRDRFIRESVFVLGVDGEAQRVAAGARFDFGHRLYRYMLACIVQAEAHRQRGDTAMNARVQAFHDQRMHLALIALCLEMVALAYEQQQQFFPWVLRVVHLHAFELGKMIEVTIRSVSGLFTHRMMVHLKRVQESILEQYAWTSDSPVWTLLERHQDRLPSVDQTFGTGLREASGVQHSALGIFMRKVYYMLGVRLADLACRLDLGDTLRLRAWTCLEHAIVEHSRLLCDRHADQLLLCAVWAAAKVSERPLRFATIIDHYKQQPQQRRETWHLALLHDSTRGSITEFYNAVFLPAVEPLLLRFTESPVRPAAGGRGAGRAAARR